MPFLKNCGHRKIYVFFYIICMLPTCSVTLVDDDDDGVSHLNDTGFLSNLRTIAKTPRQALNRFAVSHDMPEQIHISFGSRANNIVIMWSSSSKEKSYVEFGNNPQTISRVLAQSTELKEDSENAKKFIHRAELKNLSPGIHYTYRIISGLTEIKSKVLSVDVPHNSPKEKPHTFMVVADMGLLTRSLQFIVHEALSNKYDAVFHIGDIAYNLHSKGGSYGDQFMNRIQKFTSMVPYMTIPGDHERQSNFYHYRHRFSHPGASWPMKEEKLWYSIDIGYAHFIGINTKAFLNHEAFHEAQIEWLRNDLIKANQNRQQHPWIIVMGHRPLYCTKTARKQGCDGEYSEMRDVLEDLFFEYGVDLHLSGHKHCYERSWPMYKSHSFQSNSIDPKAPIYIITGTTGYPYIFHEQLSSPKWLAASATEEGRELFARLKIINNTHLIWSAHVALNNKKVDEMLLFQTRHGSFGRPGQTALDKLKLEFTQIDMKTIPASNDGNAVNMQYSRFFDSDNRNLMLLSGFVSFSFLIFLFMRYFKIKNCFRWFFH